jgi:hypothetical protein
VSVISHIEQCTAKEGGYLKTLFLRNRTVGAGCNKFLNCDQNEIYFVLLLSRKNVFCVHNLCHILFVMKIAIFLNVCGNPFSLKLNGQGTLKKMRI